VLRLARRADGGPLRIGHRGAAALAPANSLAAIDAGLAVGLDGIEIDVVAEGGRLQVAHSVGELGPDSPSLDTVLERIAASPAFLDLDLKADGVEDELAAALRRQGLVERTIVTSFLRRPLKRLAVLEPGLLLGRSFPNDRAGVVERGLPDAIVQAGLVALRPLLPFDVVRLVRGSSARVASLHHEVVSDALVRRCRRHGIPVLAWTANDPGSLGRLTALGVHGVITDDPRIFG
jgi:glycerophosphoryl diester phosphodiesterase